MKIIYSLLLVTLFLSLSSTSLAQTNSSETEEFLNLKNNNILLVSDQAKYERAIAVLTTKGSENGSIAEFILFEKTDNISIEFQPVLMKSKGFEVVGEVTRVKLRSTSIENTNTGFIASKTIFGTPKEADAVLITIKQIGLDTSEGTKLLAPLEQTPRLTKLRIRSAQTVSTITTQDPL